MSETSSNRGISFPFRIGNKGGVVMSDVTKTNPIHINESIEQILRTSKYERVMEPHIGSALDIAIFEPNEVTTHNLIKYQIIEALKVQEPRITVDKEGLSLSTDDEGNIVVDLTYTLNEYSSSHNFTTTLRRE